MDVTYELEELLQLGSAYPFALIVIKAEPDDPTLGQLEIKIRLPLGQLAGASQLHALQTALESRTKELISTDQLLALISLGAGSR